MLMVLTGLVLLLLGSDFVVGTWHSAKRNRVSFELLILAAMTGAFAYSVASLISGAGAVYFEVIAVLLVIYSIGQKIKSTFHESAQQRANSWSGGGWIARRLRDDGATERVAVDQIQKGQKVLVFPGAMVPVDGKILLGQALIRQAALTGESMPVFRQAGDIVFASTVCIDGTLTIEASCNGNQGAVDRIQQAVHRARQTPSATENMAQQLASWFLPIVAVAALLTAAYWGVSGMWDRAFLNASAVLLVACPCALGLATPIAIWAALSELAALGIVAKHGDAVTALASTDYICFDKTGTLTPNHPKVKRFVLHSKATVSLDEIKSIVATVERTSQHPIAVALSLIKPTDSNFRAVETRLLPGRGIQCNVQDRRSERAIQVAITRDENDQCVTDNHLRVRFDGTLVATIELEEHVPREVTALLATLGQLGTKTAVLSGDTEARVELLEADYQQGNMSSADKRVFVQQLKPQHRVAFVGDGFNDAEAMTAADVSLAAAWGTDFAADTADMIWLHKDFSAIVDGIRVCRQAKSVIRNNLFLAATYNMLGIAFAASGWLHPIVAAVLMLASSLTVTLRAASIRNDNHRNDGRVAEISGEIGRDVSSPIQLADGIPCCSCDQ